MSDKTSDEAWRGRIEDLADEGAIAFKEMLGDAFFRGKYDGQKAVEGIAGVLDQLDVPRVISMEGVTRSLSLIERVEQLGQEVQRWRSQFESRFGQPFDPDAPAPEPQEPGDPVEQRLDELERRVTNLGQHVGRIGPGLAR